MENSKIPELKDKVINNSSPFQMMRKLNGIEDDD